MSSSEAKALVGWRLVGIFGFSACLSATAALCYGVLALTAVINFFTAAVSQEIQISGKRAELAGLQMSEHAAAAFSKPSAF